MKGPIRFLPPPYPVSRFDTFGAVLGVLVALCGASVALYNLLLAVGG